LIDFKNNVVSGLLSIGKARLQRRGSQIVLLHQFSNGSGMNWANAKERKRKNEKRKDEQTNSSYGTCEGRCEFKKDGSAKMSNDVGQLHRVHEKGV
jgi:hypothetical protein